jgi:hypothetical protein
LAAFSEAEAPPAVLALLNRLAALGNARRLTLEDLLDAHELAQALLSELLSTD